DEITGLVTAVAMVRPSRSLYDLNASSVKKKWKDKAFAAGTNREEMAEAATEFGIELWQHVDNIILAMRSIAPRLGLEGGAYPRRGTESELIFPGKYSPTPDNLPGK
ncbi:MAG: hypothetical protein M1485_01425, partial [Chloroflexi bacterium]|nr:hypothetical protein [Chloroflexota bacterium]